MFLSKEEFPQNHPIFNIDGLYIIGETALLEAIKTIEKTMMVTINKPSLIYHCLLQLRMVFLNSISVNFQNQFIKITQNKSKRDKIAPEILKPNTKTMINRNIRKNIVEDMQGVFGEGNVVWNNIVKSMSAKKQSLRLPNFANIMEDTPIILNGNASLGIVYEAMVPLIKLLSPNFKIMDFETWSEVNICDKLSEYRSFYLNNRVREFDPNRTLFR